MYKCQMGGVNWMDAFGRFLYMKWKNINIK